MTFPVETKKSSFKIVQAFKSDYAPAQFTQYESLKTGMRVVVVDQKGPKVYGHFTLATEIHDDSGAPHTLEHLCFMGSKNYMYKGVLDKLATRAYSNTNAWTSTDNTTYTLDTAGWDGFAQILPVYLEHILFPTLTDFGCYTEVHHIDGTGHDAGVVYSEMQGVQNDQDTIMELAARRLLYPDGNGFRYETGGMMEQLRVLTAEKIRQFHRDMYQPKNLCLIISGEVDHRNLLDILDDFEADIIDQIPSIDAPFKRPWVDSIPTPPLNHTIVKTVEFPEEDEAVGEILIGFLGPGCNDALLEFALNVLLIYLSESSVSFLVNALVEKEQLASGVCHSVDVRPDIVIWFTLTGVSTEKLVDVEKRFFALLQEAATNPIDMTYMHDCLHRYKRQIVHAAESSNGVFALPIIEDHLFGNRDGSNLINAVGSLKIAETLEDWNEEQWRDFLKCWLSDANHISILGVPSAALSTKIKEDEKARVKAQQEHYGEAGLRELAGKLEEAKAENDKEIPSEMLDRFEVPGISSIHFFPTITARAGLAKSIGHLDNEIQTLIDKDTNNSKLFLYFEHVPSNFINISVSLCTSSVPLVLKPLLAIYMTNFFNTPIIRDGTRVEFEQVVNELERDTISYDIETGGSLGNSELICVKLVVEVDKYQAAITWLKSLLLNSIFDVERLQSTVTKMLADIPAEKRNGNRMAHAVDSMVHFAPKSTFRSQSTLVKALYLKETRRLLKKDPSLVVKDMEALRDTLVQFSNMRILVISNLKSIRTPVSSWDILTSSLNTNLPLSSIDSRAAMLSEAARHPGSVAYVVPIPPIDSSFLLLTARGPDSYSHPKLPALMVALAYLDAVEGPLWVAVRGTGLAYGTVFSRGTDTGLLSFRIYRSPDAFKAYSVARTTIEDYVNKNRELEKHALEGAISSIVVSFADEQPTMTDAANFSFVNVVVRGVERDWSGHMMQKVREVHEDDILAVLRDIVLPVFLPESSNLVVTCASIMTEGLEENFKKAGFNPKIRPLSDFQDDYGLHGGEDDENEDSEVPSDDDISEEDEEHSEGSLEDD